MKSPAELLRRRRYWTPIFLRLYLDHVEEIRFRDPRAGLKLAKLAPKLALLVPEAPGPVGRPPATSAGWPKLTRCAATF